MSFTLSTDAFQPGGALPPRYTCDGVGESPALYWQGAPEGTATFALFLEDPDAPGGTFTHWVIYNLPSSCQGLPAGSRQTAHWEGGDQAENDFHRIGYGAPCPPPGQDHRYIFTLYAVDGRIDVPAGHPAGQVRDALQGHVLQSAQLDSHYRREAQP